MNMTQETLAVSGLRCANCARGVREALAALDGVASVDVDAPSGAAVVAFDSARIDGDALTAAIRARGFGAEIAAPQGDAAPAPLWTARRLTATGAALILIANMAAAAFGAGVLPGWSVLALGALVTALLGPPVFAGAIAAARRRETTMDSLLALGVGAALISGFGALFLPQVFSHGHAGAAAMILTFVTLGKALEGRASAATASALRALSALRPETARVERPDGMVETIATLRLRPGDLVLLRAGERCPVDGEIIEGAGAMDESLVTGDSLPVARALGDRVLAGALNAGAALKIRAIAAAGDTELDRIAQLVAAAQGKRPKLQTLADRVAGWLVPIAVIGGLAALLGHGLGGDGWAPGLDALIAVLVITCPCALGVAGPAATVAAIGAAARAGLLVRDPDALYALADVDAVMIDKTGTLTHGAPALVGDPDAEALNVAAALAEHSTHPLSRALAAAAPGGWAVATGIVETAGCGVEGVVDGRRLRLGAPNWAGGPPPGASPHSLVRLAGEGREPVDFAFDDPLREEAADALGALTAAGLEVEILSGDRPAVVMRLADALEVSAYGGLSPQEKLDAIANAQADGARVAMVGDGVNDSPALAQADVGIAAAGGTDVAAAAAGIALMRADLRLLPAAHRLARRARATLRGNMGWAIGYNLAALPAAALGQLSPAMAGAAMAASSLCVVLNALRLSRWKAA